jgi:hypothetical protein
MKFFATAVLTFLGGIIAHLLFFPLISSWHNERVQLLARPAIGVAATAPFFLLWCHVLRGHGGHEGAAYITAFSIFGGGVAAGYVLDDLMDNA